MMERMTLAAVKATLRLVGVTVTHRDGGYRVNLLGGDEAAAYYTEDLADALATGVVMADARDKAKGREAARETKLSKPDDVSVTASNVAELRERHDGLRLQAAQLIRMTGTDGYRTLEAQQRLAKSAGDTLEQANALWSKLQAFYG